MRRAHADARTEIRLAEVEELAREAAESYTVGDPFADDTQLGPLISPPARAGPRSIDAGIADGATLVRRCGCADGLDTGYFVQADGLLQRHSDMTIAREEIFGPVLSIIPYDTEEEAIDIANDTVYGLFGSGGRWRRTRATRRPQDPRRTGARERRPRVPRRAVRRLQAIGSRPRERPVRLRGVPGGEGALRVSRTGRSDTLAAWPGTSPSSAGSTSAVIASRWTACERSSRRSASLTCAPSSPAAMCSSRPPVRVRRWSRRSRPGSRADSATPCRRSSVPPSAVRKAAALEPYGAIVAGDTHHVVFLRKAPTAAAKRATEALSNDQDRFEVHGTELHWHIHGGITDSSVKSSVLAKALGQPSTARNTKSLRKLADMLAKG